MSPTDSFRPTLSLPVEQAMSFLSLASRRIPEDEQLDTARDLGLSATAVVDENAFSETALALWESMNRASATMTMASLTPTHPTHRNLRIWLSRPYATVARARGEKIHIYCIDTEEIPHVVAANSPLRPRPEAFDGPPYLPSEFISAATDGDLDTAQAILEHLTTFGPSDSLFSQALLNRQWEYTTWTRDNITPDGLIPWAALNVLSTPSGSYLVTPPRGESSGEEATMEPVLQTVLWGQLAQLFTPPADDAKGGERA